MTTDQRRALDEARRLLAPHFAGETVRLYVARSDDAARSARNERIIEALRAGEAASIIAAREDVSRRWVSKLRVRAAPIRGTFRP